MAVEHGQRGVVDDREVHHQALPEPVLGDIGDAGRHRGAGAGELHLLAPDADAPRSRLSDAKKDPGDLGAPASDEPAKSQDLTLAHREVDAFEFPGSSEAPGFEHDVARSRLVLGIEGREFAPDHHLDGPVARQAVPALDPDEHAIAQHRDAVRDRENLVHAVADEHHRHSALLEVPHNLKQTHHFALRERCSRLVHDQHASVLRQGAGDLHQLLLGGAEHPKSRVRIDLETNRSQKRRRFLPHGHAIDCARRQLRHMAHEDVLGDREIGKKSGMLVHHRNAGSLCVKRRTEDGGLIVPHHMAQRRLIDACKHLDARAFAGAILAKQRENLA